MGTQVYRRSQTHTDANNRLVTGAPTISASAYALVREWWRRYQSRRELAGRPHHEWNDIGSAADVIAEIDKPFWRE